MSFVADLRFAFRSFTRAKGLALTVIVTLALGIGANAAMFSVVRGVLLRPLVNRDESRLIYIRQSAPGIAVENATFSVPELIDLRSRMKTVTAFGDFSTISFTMVGLGEPRVVRAGVVGGSFFDVMGLRPVRGRLIDATDDGPNAAGVAVLTHRFWTTGLKSDPNVIGKTVRLGVRSATIIGILEPSVPYPTETEIIANVVTSPHHLSATMVTGRAHRMTELFGRLAPGADLETARAELRAVHGAILKEYPEAYPPKSDFRIDAKLLRDQITSRARTVLLVLLAASALIFVIACSNVANLILARSVRREGELAIRAALGAGTGALRRTLLAESLLLCGSGRDSRGDRRAVDDASPQPICVPLLCSRPRPARRHKPAVGRRGPGPDGSGAARVRAAPAVGRRRRRPWTLQRKRAHHVRHEPPPPAVCHHADCRVVRAARGRRHAVDDARRAATRADRLRDAAGARGARAGDALRPDAGGESRVLPGRHAAGRAAARRRSRVARIVGALAGWARSIVRRTILCRRVREGGR